MVKRCYECKKIIEIAYNADGHIYCSKCVKPFKKQSGLENFVKS